MSSIEAEGDQIEDPNWAPSINIRPHHLLEPEIVGAIIGIELMSVNPYAPELRADYPNDFAVYIADAYGEDAKPKESLIELKSSIFSLGDDEVVHLDIGKDGICNACPVGKHCDATNAMLFGKNVDRCEREQKVINNTHEKLLDAGFIEGVDFVFRQTSYELLNYHGENLWENDNEPTPKTVSFNSMLVRMVALRKIV